MRLLALPLVLLAGACAGTGGAAFPEGGRTPARIYTKAGTYDATSMVEPQVSTLSLSDSPETVWSRLPGAFQELGLAVNYVEPGERELGSLNVRLVRTLAGEPVSRYLDCGSGRGGINANTHQIDLSVVAAVEPGAGEGATLQVRVEASATPLGTSASTSRCNSTGRLEEELAMSLAAPGR